MPKQPNAMVLGTGSFVADKILTNFDLEKIVDTSDQWIRERSGIERRHVLPDELTNSDQAAEASKRALEDAGVTPEEITHLIIGTVTPDSGFPSTACRVQAKIGLINAAALDISAACSGFLYGLNLANSIILENPKAKVLVLGSEVLTRITDWEDRGTCVLFGDGAGAAVLGASDGERGLLANYMKSDGRLGDLLYMPGNGVTHPTSHETVDQRMHYIKMAGREVFKHAVKAMSDAALHALDLAGYQHEDLDLLIPHQANVRIIDAIAKRLKMDHEKVFKNIQDFGNTSAASIPIALNQARQEGTIKEGTLCMLVAFGGGFTWAANLIKF